MIENIKLCECGCGGIPPLARKTSYRKGIIKGEPVRFIPYHHMKGVPKSIIQKEKMARARKEWYQKNPDKAILKALKSSQTKIRDGSVSLERNGRWIDGRSYGEYSFDFNGQFRKAIRLRDNRCLLCNLSLDNAMKIRKIMHVHHIDYNKKNTSLDNCCLLCANCHSITQIHRKHWTLFFKSLMNELYGYLFMQYLEGGVQGWQEK